MYDRGFEMAAENLPDEELYDSTIEARAWLEKYAMPVDRILRKA